MGIRGAGLTVGLIWLNKVSIPSNGAWVYGANPRLLDLPAPYCFNPLKRGMGIRGPCLIL